MNMMELTGKQIHERAAFEWLETEISAVDCRYRGDPGYDHDAHWMKEKALKLVREAEEIFARATTPKPTTQFEAWAKLHHYDLTRCSHEPYAAYRSELTNAALAGWRGAKHALEPFEYDEPRNVRGMTRAEFEHHLRICYQHDNVRAQERGIGPKWNGPVGLTPQDEREIAERVERKYPQRNTCPGCFAFDSGASEVEFAQGCEGCMNRMLKINGNPHGAIIPVSESACPFCGAVHDGNSCMEAYRERATAPQPNHYQQLLGVAYVVLGCLAANGVDIPVRFLDAFSDPDSVENPLELLPCDFSPAQAVRAAVEAAALTDEQRESIREAAQCLAYAVTMTQDGYDGETGPASEWDAAAQRLSGELNAMLAAPQEQSC